MKKPKSVKQILGSHTSGLDELTRRSRQLNLLNQQLSRLLPPSLSQHCAVAGISQKTLILLADSSSWASRLRLQGPHLIKALQEFQIESLSIKVRPKQAEPQPAQTISRSISGDTCTLLNQLASSIHDPKLKQALLRLARHQSN